MTDYEREFQNNPEACGEPFREIRAFFEDQKAWVIIYEKGNFRFAQKRQADG